MEVLSYCELALRVQKCEASRTACSTRATIEPAGRDDNRVLGCLYPVHLKDRPSKKSLIDGVDAWIFG